MRTPRMLIADAPHPNARLGPANGNWRGGERVTHHGYAQVLVGREHPLADVYGYAYVHLLVWVSAGNEPPADGYELDHEDGHKQHNKLGNLRVITTAEHSRRHAAEKPRVRGRFVRAVCDATPVVMYDVAAEVVTP